MQTRRLIGSLALLGLFGLSALAPLAALVPQPAAAPVSHPIVAHTDAFIAARVGVGASSDGSMDRAPSRQAGFALFADRDAVTWTLAARALDAGEASSDPDAASVADVAIGAVQGAAAPEGASTTVQDGRPTFVLLLVASQQTAAMLGLGPQPGVAAPLPSPVAGLTTPMHAAVVTLAPSFVDAGEAPGWLRQAAWTVALAAFGILAVRGVAAYVLLFSRFAREEVLANDRRGKLFDAIRADPGVAFGRLRAVTGWAPGVVQHHLRLLEQHGLVRRIRDGRTTHFFPAGPRPAPTACLAPARRGLLEALKTEPGLSLAELALRQGHRAQSVWGHLDRLRRAGLVLSERRGRSMHWSLAPTPA